jgi:hypothetical protein
MAARFGNRVDAVREYRRLFGAPPRTEVEQMRVVVQR